MTPDFHSRHLLLPGLFCLLLLLEFLAPRRPFALPRLRRDAVNLGLTLLNNLMLYLLLPAAAVGAAISAREGGWGLLNLAILPPAAAFIAAFLFLDLVIYWQHRLFHRRALLWRLHRVHHTDEELDVTTGSRFHPVEILISMFIKLAAVTVSGAPPAAVAAFELALAATSLFNHANIRLTGRLDAALRLIVVTPDYHRVHHSVERAETDSNFGFNLPWWDRLLGTYRAQPRGAHETMPLGLKEFRGPEWISLPRLLALPFRSYTASDRR
ncbi:MAG: sterol desaturase [Elusimicrobia bacterium]|nr:MAG: sterol desaturase [Elusimicrobiota bacterium]KAF0154016.1 MAG: sterol desaturase [Elusimicrobiota bacterium]